MKRWKDVPVNGTGPPGFYQMQRMTGWDALQTYIGDLRSIAQKGQNRTLMNESAEFRFVIENGAGLGRTRDSGSSSGGIR